MEPNETPEEEQLARETVNRLLDERLASTDLGPTRVFFVHGHPRSDIGKGNLTARLATLPEGSSSIIKFDGILNTNVNGQHPSPYDDFGTYRRFLPAIGMGGPHQILGGEVVRDFVVEFGGTNDHLSFVPHVAKYFAVRILESWAKIGRPDNLFVEIGGTLTDFEVTSYALPGIAMFHRRFPQSSLFLLTELEYCGEVVKTKTVVNGLKAAAKYGLTYDTLFIRRPAALGNERPDELLARYTARKISNSLVYGGDCPSIVMLPYFNDPEMTGYLELLRARMRAIHGLLR